MHSQSCCERQAASSQRAAGVTGGAARLGSPVVPRASTKSQSKPEDAGKQKRHRRTSVIPGEALSIRGGLPAPSLWSGQRGASVRGRGAAAGRSPRRAGSPSPTWSRCHVAQAPRRQGAVPAAGGLRHQPLGHLCASQGASPSHGRCPRRPALRRLARGGRELRARGVSLRPARLAPSPGRAPLIFCQEGRRQSPPSSRPAHAWALPPLTVAPTAEAFLSHRLDPPRMRSRSPGAGRGGLEGLPTWRCFPPGPDARSSRGGRGARAWRHPHAPILRAPRAQTWAPGRATRGAGRSRGRGPPAPAGVMCPCVPGALVKLFSCDSALCGPSAFGFGMCCFQSNSFDVVLFCLLIHQMDVLLTCYCEKFQMWG